MSPIALSAASVIAAILVALFFWIRSRYRLALTSVDEKQGGVLSYYRVRLHLLLQGKEHSPESLACGAHYLLLHVLAPFFLAGLILHTDWNFLVAIGSILTSVQLIQRVFPGMEPSDVETESD